MVTGTGMVTGALPSGEAVHTPRSRAKPGSDARGYGVRRDTDFQDVARYTRTNRTAIALIA